MTRIVKQTLAAVVAMLAGCASIAQVQQESPQPFPFREKLSYRVEWRLITAGTAKIDISPLGTNWQTKLSIQSAGMVTKLYRVDDNYRALTTDKFCGINVMLDAQEGKRHRLSSLTFDNGRHKLQFEERDLIRNNINSKVSDITPCTHEVLGALAYLRTIRAEPGKTLMLPITDGKKIVMARIEAQAREKIEVDNKTYETIRYEAFLFDNVLYTRRGRLWLWMTDDASRLPVQIRVRLGFPIGNITLTLDKDERS